MAKLPARVPIAARAVACIMLCAAMIRVPRARQGPRVQLHAEGGDGTVCAAGADTVRLVRACRELFSEIHEYRSNKRRYVSSTVSKPWKWSRVVVGRPEPHV